MASKRFGVSLKQLRELMEFRGAEGVQKLNEIGGLRGLLNALNTSEEQGKESEHLLDYFERYMHPKERKKTYWRHLGSAYGFCKFLSWCLDTSITIIL